MNALLVLHHPSQTEHARLQVVLARIVCVRRASHLGLVIPHRLLPLRSPDTLAMDWLVSLSTTKTEISIDSQTYSVSVWTAFLRGLLIPVASLAIIVLPALPLLYVTDGTQDKRLLWVLIVGWALSWLVLVSFHPYRQSDTPILIRCCRTTFPPSPWYDKWCDWSTIACSKFFQRT